MEPTHDIDELLTGLVDNQLTANERAEVQRRLDDDPGLRRRYRELVRLRQLVAQLPDVPVRVDFAAVAIAARSSQVSPARSSRWRRVAYAAASLAAGLLIMVSWNWQRQSDPTNNVASGGSQDPAANLSELASANASATPSATTSVTPAPSTPLPAEDGLTERELAASETPDSLSPEDAAPSTRPSLENAVAASSLAGAVALPASESDRNDAAKALMPETRATINDLASVDASGSNDIRADDLEALGLGIAEGVLLVVDIKAAEASVAGVEPTDLLLDLLGRYDIAAGNQIDAGQPVVDALRQSRIIAAANEDLGQQPSSFDLVFVKGRATRLDAAILDLMGDTQHYSEFGLDIAVDPPALELFSQLRGVREVADNSPAVSVASPLRYSGQWQAVRRARPMDRQQREQAASLGMVGGGLGNPVSYALFIVRQP